MLNTIREYLTADSSDPLMGPIAVIFFITTVLFFTWRIDKEAEDAQRLNGDIP